MSELGVVRVNHSGLGIRHREAADGEVRGRGYGPEPNLGKNAMLQVAGVGYSKTTSGSDDTPYQMISHLSESFQKFLGSLGRAQCHSHEKKP